MSAPPPPPGPLQHQKRIKRQRRKLRGKYSGDCVSCEAKWSKCWYIASVDNKMEWETRLSTPVRPCDDEVCFQCWDGKIRTSPKRKQIKVDTPDANPGLSFNPIPLTADSRQGPILTPAHLDLDPVPSSDPALDLREDPDSGPHKKPRSPTSTQTTVEDASNETDELGNPLPDNDGDLEEHEAAFLLYNAFKIFPSSPDIDNTHVHSIGVHANTMVGGKRTEFQ